MTDRTREACARLFRGSERILPYGPGRPFPVGDLRVEPFLTVHDARSTRSAWALVDQCTGLRLGIATDLGRPTVQIRHALALCDFLVLEANHDEVLLHTSRYPLLRQAQDLLESRPPLEPGARRPAGDGASSSPAGGRGARTPLRECNRPELALEVVGSGARRCGLAGSSGGRGQDRPTALLDVEELRYRSGPSQLSLL